MNSVILKSTKDIYTNTSNGSEITLTLADLTSASGLNINSASTAASGNTQALVRVALSGANATSTQTTYATTIDNTHTGTSSTNVGLSVTASGGSNNYGLLVTGRTGLGIATPAEVLDVTGNIQLNTVGNKILIKTGTNASAGTAVLVAGTVTVSNTLVTANSIIQVTSQNTSGSHGAVKVSGRTAGTSFTITSYTFSLNTASVETGDTSNVGWVIIEPAA